MNSVQKQNWITGLASVGICLAILLLTILSWRAGWLRFVEFQIYDQLVRWRAPANPDPSPIVLVAMNDADIVDPAYGGWPLSDSRLAALLEKLETYQPVVIGMDLFRDVPVPISGAELGELNEVLKRYPNIVVIRRFSMEGELDIPPPPILQDEPDRVTVNDFPIDDETSSFVRRAFLFLDDYETHYYSLALRLALIYLEAELNIFPETAGDSSNMRLGHHVFVPLEKNDGAYVNLDARGYQMLLDFRGPRSYPTYPLSEVMNGDLPQESLAGKIVLVGVIAQTVKDNLRTPLDPRRSGLELHADILDQFLRLATGQDQAWKFLSEREEFVWLLIWVLAGTFIGFKTRNVNVFVLAILGGLAILVAVTVIAFYLDWWIPLALPAVAFLPAAGLITSFQYHQERKDRSMLMQLFSKHVSREIAQSIWEQRGEFLDGHRPRSQRLTATLFFSDMRDFSTVSEKQDPSALIDWLNEYMEVMSAQILQRGGVINEYIGDAIMATFGIPVPRTTQAQIAHDARQAVESALAMAQGLTELNRRWKAEQKPTTSMRVGIFTGPVVTGSLGGSERLKFSVVGDTVNTAARLEQFKKEANDPDSPFPDCRILVGQPTWELLGDAFEGKLIGQFPLKGKEEQVTIYHIFGHRRTI